jgi:predicted Na+-dependent transporter
VCSPTSLSQAITLVIQGYGNGALSLFLTVVTNLLGIVTTPLFVSMVSEQCAAMGTLVTGILLPMHLTHRQLLREMSSLSIQFLDRFTIPTAGPASHCAPLQRLVQACLAVPTLWQVLGPAGAIDKVGLLVKLLVQILVPLVIGKGARELLKPVQVFAKKYKVRATHWEGLALWLNLCVCLAIRVPQDACLAVHSYGLAWHAACTTWLIRALHQPAGVCVLPPAQR